MPYIFRFHKGTNNNIYDWAPSDKISSGDVRDVVDKTNIVSSSAGSSIPTPLARMYLFKTAFEIMAVQVADNNVDPKSIYAGLVSESLDLLELLFKCGSDGKRFRYVKWVFDIAGGSAETSGFFGKEHGHRLLAETFSQIATQKPFNGKIEITLIYYREADAEILLGGTSPFTFVFTTPNFKRKKREKGIRDIFGMAASEPLFSNPYKQLYEREESFIKYISTLKNSEGIAKSFSGFSEYVTNCYNRFPEKFNAMEPKLQEIYIQDNNQLKAGSISIRQLSEEDFQIRVSQFSDFKMDLPYHSHYFKDMFPPLFLYSNMDMDGQYTSPSNHWSDKTIVSPLAYPETTVEEIYRRELPGIKGISYPFLSTFDIFEKALIKLPSYFLNDERFQTLIDNQDFILPIRPLFFYFFPLNQIRDFISIKREKKGLDLPDEIIVKVTIPLIGPTYGRREITLMQTYSENISSAKEDEKKYPMISFKGILAIFPFTKSSIEELKYINNYTIASYEKTNVSERLNELNFYKEDGVTTIVSNSFKRSEYKEVNTESSYHQVKESFEIIQLSFIINNSAVNGIIIPKFKEVIDGKAEYVYAIDFGTSNTHIEFAQVDEYNKAKDTKPLEVNEKGMLMAMLNKPTRIKEKDGTVEHNDHAQFGNEVDSVRPILLREFTPIQIGEHQGSTTRFPFRSAVFESRGIKIVKEPNLFIDANIGFNIERDTLVGNFDYSTDIKWQLESNLNDTVKQNRVKLFFRQLLLMIRTHALTSTSPVADLSRLKITMSYPISMDLDLKDYLTEFFNAEVMSVFNVDQNHISKRSIEIKESIAPYYYLKKTHSGIQNDIYCNIDVGGGTSDLVLVSKKNGILNCHCSSVKFAGAQLWGSVSDNNFDPNDNGFLKFYLRQLQHKDPASYDKLNKIIKSKSNSLQDLVSYLFNEKDFKFKFSQIFIECKELKIPLLLHYSALLYYVAKSSKNNYNELPKTISFSGKGSEYIDFIFRSPDHLRQFTQLALSVFSGLPQPREFSIKRDPNPKVITAKGAAIYGANPLGNVEQDIFGTNSGDSPKDEDQIQTYEKIYYGFDDPKLEDRELTYADLYESANSGIEYTSIMNSSVDFLESFFDSTQLVKGSELALNINNLGKYKGFFIESRQDFDYLKEGALRRSYKLVSEEEKDRSRKVADPPFFFAFKRSLIELSIRIADEAIKNMKI